MSDKSKTKPKYKLIIERRFVGDKSLADVMLPILIDDIRRRQNAAHSTETKPESKI